MAFFRSVRLQQGGEKTSCQVAVRILVWLMGGFGKPTDQNRRSSQAVKRFFLQFRIGLKLIYGGISILSFNRLSPFLSQSIPLIPLCTCQLLSMFLITPLFIFSV